MKTVKITDKQKEVIKDWRQTNYASYALRAYLESDSVLFVKLHTVDSLEKKGICEYAGQTPKYNAPLYQLTKLGRTIALALILIISSYTN